MVDSAPAYIGSLVSPIFPLFPKVYSFNPEAFYFFNYLPKLSTYEGYVEEDNPYFTTYMYEPLGVANSHYMSLDSARAEEHIEFYFSNFPFSDFRHVNTRSYLRSWLIYISPQRISSCGPQSSFLFFTSSYEVVPRLNLFPLLTRLLDFYGYLAALLDYLTGYSYYTYATDVIANPGLIQQLRNYNFIISSGAYFSSRFVIGYASFLHHFYYHFDWDLVNDTPGFAYVYSEICRLINQNYKLIRSSGKANDSDFSFIHFVLFYQMVGGSYSR